MLLIITYLLILFIAHYKFIWSLSHLSSEGHTAAGSAQPRGPDVAWGTDQAGALGLLRSHSSLGSSVGLESLDMWSVNISLMIITQTLTAVFAWGAAPVGEGPQNGKLGQDTGSTPGGSWGNAETLDRTRRHERLSAASMVILWRD